MSRRPFIVASRASQLAQIQTKHVVSLFEAATKDAETVPLFTTLFVATEAGDTDKEKALYLMGGKALWTKELEVGLQENKLDMLVHSLKDVPTVLPEGCMIGAICEREDPVDCLVVKKGKEWKTLADLPDGSVVGTSSIRRIAQLKRRYPHLKTIDIRGNIDTRMKKLDAENGPYSAIILAKAGLLRMGWANRISSDLTPPDLFYAVSQGALGVEIRVDDHEALELCKKITHRPTQLKCLAERACLRVLEGGCTVPVGVFTTLDEQDLLTITACVTSLDGTEHVEHTLESKVESPQDAEALGAKIAKLLIDTGAKKILEEIQKDRETKRKELAV